MIYITYSQPARYHQLTFEEMMAGITVNDIESRKNSGTLPIFRSFAHDFRCLRIHITP